jgi:putative membrane protein
MKYHATLLMIFAAVFVWSGINPHDYFTWFLEIFPAIIGLVVLALTYKKFKLTNLLYTLILIHSIILMVGGHYTYAEVPLFDWLREAFDQGRNNYDKVGHFAQGFIPAMITREILLRHKVVNGRAWLNIFIVTMSMAISVSYEFIEWFVAELSGESAESFLGTQGYIWDTQSDMLYATIGAIMALILLSKIHDQLLQKV